MVGIQSNFIGLYILKETNNGEGSRLNCWVRRWQHKNVIVILSVLVIRSLMDNFYNGMKKLMYKSRLRKEGLMETIGFGNNQTTQKIILWLRMLRGVMVQI